MPHSAIMDEGRVRSEHQNAQWAKPQGCPSHSGIKKTARTTGCPSLYLRVRLLSAQAPRCHSFTDPLVICMSDQGNCRGADSKILWDIFPSSKTGATPLYSPLFQVIKKGSCWWQLNDTPLGVDKAVYKLQGSNSVPPSPVTGFGRQQQGHNLASSALLKNREWDQCFFF